MTDKLPPNLLALFAPRPPLRYLPPADHPPEERSTARITGIAQYLPALKEKAAAAASVEAGDSVDPELAERERPPTESKLEAHERKHREKLERQQWLVTKGVDELYKPTKDPNIRGDAFKTLFVGRLSYDTDIRDLEKEFGRFGPIERIRIVTENSPDGKVSKKHGKSRGYAFVVYERERDMKAAYKEMDHLYIRGRRTIVDVERGRTVAGWKPRRFGGGLGGRGYTKASAPKPTFGFGAPAAPGGFRGGGFRGGFDRGGFRGGRGSFRGGGGYGGGRGGLGYSNGPPPDGAPAGPRSGGGPGGGFGPRGPGGGYDDRGPRNANYEPLPPRGGHRDRDDRGGGGYNSHKRPHEGSGYEDSRSRRRY